MTGIVVLQPLQEAKGLRGREQEPRQPQPRHSLDGTTWIAAVPEGTAPLHDCCPEPIMAMSR